MEAELYQVFTTNDFYNLELWAFSLEQALRAFNYVTEEAELYRDYRLKAEGSRLKAKMLKNH